MVTFNRKLGEALEYQQEIPLYYGSEFQDPTSISNQFYHHEDIDKIIYINRKGSQYHITPINEETSKSDLSAITLRGNHKSAKTNLDATALEKAMGNEVKHSWSVPLTIDLVPHINNMVVILIGVAEQFSFNEKRYRYTKRCVTHDLYFPGPSGLSLNNRILKGTLQPYYYRFFLLIIIHMIAAMWIKWP